MSQKGKRNETLQLHANPIKARKINTFAKRAPSHQEISRRAYEIYLERDSFGGNELDDWRQAESELRRNAMVSELQRKHSRKHAIAQLENDSLKRQLTD